MSDPTHGKKAKMATVEVRGIKPRVWGRLHIPFGILIGVVVSARAVIPELERKGGGFWLLLTFLFIAVGIAFAVWILAMGQAVLLNRVFKMCGGGPVFDVSVEFAVPEPKGPFIPPTALVNSRAPKQERFQLPKAGNGAQEGRASQPASGPG